MTGGTRTPLHALAAAVREPGGTTALSAALYDYATGESWAHDGDRAFHAASTIKIAVLAGVYAALERRNLTSQHRLLVYNRFTSAADGAPFRVPLARDSDADVHASVGTHMTVRDLASHMIAVSSNLATNILLDFATVRDARDALAAAGIRGVDLVRGVEDDRAFERGIRNEVTASGLVGLLRAIHDGRFASPARTAEMMAILSAQMFRSGIPAGLPPAVRETARVAHKTGEIATATHDAGLVFLPGRPPYVLAVLTGCGGAAPGRYAAISRISSAAYRVVTGGQPPHPA